MPDMKTPAEIKFPQGVVVYGPPACGKTFHAEAMREAMGANRVVDGWWPGDPIEPGALHLTNAGLDLIAPYDVPKLTFGTAMAMVNLRALERDRLARTKSDEPMTCADFAERHGLNVGDQARLKSCDVWMTVTYSDCHEAECAWFSGRDLHTQVFPLECLTTEDVAPF